MFLFLLNQGFTQGIIINIASPTQYQVAGNTLGIQVRIQSDYEIANVTANIDTTQTPLAYNAGSNYFEGVLSLARKNQGDTLSLDVTAIDHFGNRQTATRKIIYDVPPQVSLISPSNYSVARPFVHVKATCTDTDSCTVNISFAQSSVFTGKIKDSLDINLDLSTFDGKSGDLTLRVTDKRNQTSQAVSNTIYVESSTKLISYYTGDFRVLDFNYNRVLFVDDSNQNRLAFMDLSTNTKTIIPFSGVVDVQAAYLTHYGAVFGGTSSPQMPSASTNLFEWDGINVTDLGELNSRLSIHLAGNYLSWSKGTALYLRNLLSKSNVLVSTSAGNINNDLDTNGRVVFWDYTYNIVSYRNGTQSVITDNTSNSWNTYPVCDENYIVYRNNQPFSIYLFDGGNKVLLSTSNGEASPGDDYQVRNKFVAYTKPGTSGQKQVWLRDTTGVSSQLTFSGSNSFVDRLNGKGEIMLKTGPLNSQKRAIVYYRGAADTIGSVLGKTYFFNNEWYVAMGRSIFKVNSLEPLPLDLLSFTAELRDNKTFLNWETVRETRIQSIVVERSADGIAFLEIGRQNPVNSFNSVSKYSYNDEQVPEGKSYYRIRFIDMEGKPDFSPVKMITKSIPKANIYPNPAHDHLYVKFSTARREDVTMQLLTTEGKIVKRIKLSNITGSYIEKINISALRSDRYFVEIISSSGRSTFTFQKY